MGKEILGQAEGRTQRAIASFRRIFSNGVAPSRQGRMTASWLVNQNASRSSFRRHRLKVKVFALAFALAAWQYIPGEL